MTWPLRLVVALVSSLSLACASTGTSGGKTAVVPRPFPGAPAPPAATNEPVVPGPPSVAAPENLGSAPPVVLTALTLRGTPYRNGGSQPAQGFDCSGFVQWVFAQHGTRLPREVREQFDEGESIDGRAVRAGDLVFFETVSRGPSHVGIAIGGDEFVHAPSARGVVRIERLSSSYWSKRWIGSRRIAPASTNTDRLAD